jgi:hypothetical protein
MCIRGLVRTTVSYSISSFKQCWIFLLPLERGKCNFSVTLTVLLLYKYLFFSHGIQQTVGQRIVINNYVHIVC